LLLLLLLAAQVLEETGVHIRDARFATAVNTFWPETGKHYVTLFMLASADKVRSGWQGIAVFLCILQCLYPANVAVQQLLPVMAPLQLTYPQRCAQAQLSHLLLLAKRTQHATLTLLLLWLGCARWSHSCWSLINAMDGAGCSGRIYQARASVPCSS
jgi:hypothetical protein